MIHSAPDAATNHLHDRLADLEIALAAGDDDKALSAARNLRAAVDGLCQRMTLAQFAPMAQAKADLARILTSKGRKLPLSHEALARAMEE